MYNVYLHVSTLQVKIYYFKEGSNVKIKYNLIKKMRTITQEAIIITIYVVLWQKSPLKVL